MKRDPVSVARVMRRIMEKVSFQKNGCWRWNGALAGNDRKKYGVIAVEGKNLVVRRLLYTLLGLSPELGDCATASSDDCTDPRCVNPYHLVRVKCHKGGRDPRPRASRLSGADELSLFAEVG